MTEAEKINAMLQALMAEQARQQSAQEQPAQDTGASARNPDGTYGTPPEGMIANPYTGQMTERSLIAGNVDPMTAGQAFRRGGTQGLSFNFGDEIQGRVDAMSQSGGTSEERYAFGRERARAMNEAARDQHGGAYLAGEIGGGIAAAGASAPLTFGASTLGQAALRGGAIGAAEGATYGLGRGENLNDRLGNAVTDGAIGALGGVAAPYAIAGGGGRSDGIPDDGRLGHSGPRQSARIGARRRRVGGRTARLPRGPSI